MKLAPWIPMVLFAVPLFLSAPPVEAQDSMVVAPQFHKVLIDNDKVRVLEVTLKPGDKIPMHSHPGGYVSISMSGSKARFVNADGKSADREMKANEPVWSDAVTHTAENIGTNETKVIVVELKVPKK
jgi:beta-alanine degradation protein BauB